MGLGLLVWGLLCLVWSAAPVRAESEVCYFRMIKSGSPSKTDLNQCLVIQTNLFRRAQSARDKSKYLFRVGRLHGLLHKKTGSQPHFDQAVDAYRRLIKRYNRSRLADDAQYNIGELYLVHKKNPVRAYVEFLKVELNHPGGDMVPAARERLREVSRTIEASQSAKARADTRTPAKPRAGKNGPAKPVLPPVKPKPKPHPVNLAGTGMARVTGLRHWSTASYTRVVVDLTEPVATDAHLLKPDPAIDKPARLFVDLTRARLTPEAKRKIDISNLHLRSARLGQQDSETVRVVLDIKTIKSYKAFVLQSPPRLVIDVIGPRKGEKATAPPPPPPPPRIAKVKPKPRKPTKLPRGLAGPEAGPSLATQLGLGVRTVVIDPGHGGKDPGAQTCKAGLIEKNITLRTAKKLARLIKNKLGLKVILTRSRDKFVPLEERTAIANTKHADVFISIHVNAAADRRLSGVETYFLNLATDARSIELAARENATSTKSISDLQNILNDLMLNTKINESNRLAFQTQRRLISSLKSGYTRVRSLGVKQAPFYVLLGAQMPAILIEIGFGSNPQDCRRLGSEKYLNKVAEGITKGLAAYIRQIKSAGPGNGSTGAKMRSKKPASKK